MSVSDEIQNFALVEQTQCGDPENEDRKAGIAPGRWRLPLSKLLEEPANSITAFATLALVIYTAFLARYASQQTEYSSQQTLIQNEQLARIDRALLQTERLIVDANSQARSSEIQAAEAIRSNNQSLANAVVQLRPYMSVVRTIYDSNSSELPIAVELKNGGQTPALRFVFRTRMMLTTIDKANAVIERGLDDSGKIPTDDTAQLVGSGNTVEGVLNPDALDESSLSFIALHNFASKDISQYRSGQKILWVSGFAFYGDIFGGTARLRFCYFIDGPTHHTDRCAKNNDLVFYQGAKRD